MTTAAKGGFPGCPRRKIEKRKIRNSNHRIQRQKWENNLAILDQIKRNICRFYETFGNSDEDDEFHGFSSEECGLIAYKRIAGSNQGPSRVPDILGSPIDLNKKKVTTRLAHAKKSQDTVSSRQVKRRKRATTQTKYSKAEVLKRNEVQAESVGSCGSQESDDLDQCFTKYTSSNLDFHRLSKSTSFGSRPSTLKQPVRNSHKTSPIKPATFIAPSMSNNNSHQVTNVTPTCLKIKLNPLDETGPGHPKVIAKALLARANRRGRKPAVRELDVPIHTSTPINATSKSKTKSFILPTKSSRSSRIIKANRKYVDDDSQNNEDQEIASFQPVIQSPPSEQSKTCHFQSYDSPSPNKGRPLLKEPTFRVAALANINNKPQPSRNDKVISTRMRARKLIKRARFKHPTSSSTLVVGNDFDDETNRKKNLIREATFKMPDQRQSRSSASKSEKNQLSDLGLSKEEWEKVLQNEIKYETKAPLWTVQEVHNVLQGANTFSNSWTSVARHFDYHPCHRDWCSVRTKSRTLINIGLLSENLKVKSSILLQLKPQYSNNPNVTVFTAKELRIRGMERNLECDVGEGGRMIKGLQVIKNQDGELQKGSLQRQRKRSQQSHRNYYNQWKKSISEDSDDANSMYFGLDKAHFQRMCVARIKGKLSWSVREIHNVLHGIHIFGVGEWNTIHEMYAFNPRHNNLGIRGRYKSVCCRGLVIAGEVKEDILKMLRPKFSTKGKKYFGIKSNISCQVDSTKAKKQVNDTQIIDQNLDGNKQRSRKRTASSETISDSDMTSPPRKQAYHLFGAAPVWDDSGSGLQSLKSNSEIEEDAVCAQSTFPDMDKKGESSENETDRKIANDSTSSTKAKKQTTNLDTKKKTSGPRIKHVCRRASLVTGQKQATYDDDSVNPQLSALPKDERQKIAAEAERLRDVKTNMSISSDSDSESNCSPVKAVIRRKEKTKPSQVHQIRKRHDRNNTKTKRCKSCINCNIASCGECENCRSPSLARECIRKLPCLNPIDNIAHFEKTRQQPKRNSAFAPSDDMQKDVQRTASSGVILSPDSRHKLQQELHERDQHLPSIVKVDEWKERYELEDLWKMGGVSIITSTTPSTRLLCFLCGSVGRTRPNRRVSSTSDSSISSSRSNCTTQTPLFIFCYSCCEPFHSFCLDDHEQQPAIAAAKKGIWICKRCRFCNVCGRPGNLLECKRCNKTYHSACLGPSYPTKPSKNQVWVCMRCVRCRSCGVSRPGRRPGSKWTHDFQLCQRCGDLFDKGNFCPICRRCYRDEDYESRMVQCGTCKRWVHSRCESLTTEMYTLLSHLPDDVQYVCPDCDGRRNKVELDLSHSDTILTDDSANDSLEGDKMRGLLCKLPSPSWKKRIEGEVQSGIENVMMALFHNKEAACILKTSVVQQEDGRPVDLFAVRFAVHNRQYKSVSDFSSDVCCILDTVSEEAPQTDMMKDEKLCRKWKRKRNTVGARGAFFKEMHDIFPWFDVETGRVRDASDVPEDLLPHATLPPYMDHNYAQWQDRDIDIMSGGPDTPIKNPFANDSPSKPDDIGTVVWATTPQKQYDDMRQCLFCAQYGDDHATNAGRLVYCGQDEWVHVNCALWSAEVFERHDGSLQNVYSAVSRGKMMKCELCKLPGATVGCNTKDCPQNYHFACAKLNGCVFQDDKKVFCARHVKHVDNEVVAEEGFEVARRVVVDKDEMRPNKRWQQGMFSQNITILMGSAIVHQLGQLTSSSDHKDYLIPVQFRMTRMFWSTMHAGRRVRYTITVTEQKSVTDGPARISGLGSPSASKTESHGNRTISHADDDKPSITTSLQTNRIPSVDSCRSKLVDRFHTKPDHGPLHRRRSQDQSRVDPGILRSRRFSGSSYTVIGSVNRTLPQAITPLPSISRSSTTFQRLLPTVQESKNNEFYRSPSEIDKSIPSAKTVFSSDSQESDIKDAVKVTFQNPYLNVGLDMGDDNKKNSSLATTASLTHITARDTDKISCTKISSSADVSPTPLNSKVVDENNTVESPTLPNVTTTTVTSSDCTSGTLKHFGIDSNFNIKSGSSGSNLSGIQPPQSVRDDFGKVVLPLVSTVSDSTVAISSMHNVSNSKPDNFCTFDASAQHPEADKYDGRKHSLLDQMLSCTESTIFADQKILVKSSESVQALCETEHQISNSNAPKHVDDEVALVKDTYEFSEPSEMKLASKEDPLQTSNKPGICTDKESMEIEFTTQNSTCFTDSKVKALSSKQGTPSPPSQTVYSFEENDHSHSLGLLKGARRAQDEESTENVKSQKTVELERLWWQKDKSSAKTTKSHKKTARKSDTSVDDTWVLPESEKNSMRYNMSFQEDKVSRVQTRSRVSRKENSNIVVPISDASEKEIPKDDLEVKKRKDIESCADVINTPMVTVSPDDKTMDISNEKMDTNEENDIEETCVDNNTDIKGLKDVGIILKKDNEDIDKRDHNLELEEKNVETKSIENIINEPNKDVVEESDLSLNKISTSSENSTEDVENDEPKLKPADIDDNIQDKKTDGSYASTPSSETSSFASSLSEGSYIEASKDIVKIRSLRKFAKNTGESDAECAKVAVVIPTKKASKKRSRNNDIMVFRRTTRSFSHESPPITVKHDKVICNGSSDPGNHGKLSQKDVRVRSKSVDAAKKKKQKSDALEKVRNDLEISDSEFSAHRYPRRNPFTCLKSFSGLSPNYAIQSYSPNNQGRQNRAAARLLQYPRRSAKKSKNNAINKRKTQQSRSKSKTEKLSGTPTKNVIKKEALVELPETCETVKVAEEQHGKVEVKQSHSNSKSKMESSSTNQIEEDLLEFSDPCHDKESCKNTNPVFEKEINEQVTESRCNEETSVVGSESPKKNSNSGNASPQCVITKTGSQNEDFEDVPKDDDVIKKVEHNQDENVLSLNSNIQVKDVATSSVDTVEKHCDTEMEKSSRKQESSEQNPTEVHETSKADEFCLSQTSITFENEDSVSLPSTGAKTSLLNLDCDIERIESGSMTGAIEKENNILSKIVTDAQTTASPEVELINKDSLENDAPEEIECSNHLATTNTTLDNGGEISEELPLHTAEERPFSPENGGITGTSADDSYNDSIEIVRGIIEEDEKRKEVISSVLPEPDIKHNDHNHSAHLVTNLPDSPPISNSLPIKNDLVNFAQENQKVYCNTVDELESPLSPRDEPRLPLPMETDATASFLVTSDCPVLNADEVQSLLAMPPTTTTCCDVSTPDAPALSTVHNQQSHQSSYQKQYISVVNEVPQTYLTSSKDVALFPVTYTPSPQQVPLVVPVYNHSCVNQSMNIAIANSPSGDLSTPYGLQSGLSQPILISPPANKASQPVRFTYGMSFGNQIMPVVVPDASQSLTYIATPMQQSNQALVVQPNHITTLQYNQYHDTRPSSVNILQQGIAGRDGYSQCNSQPVTNCKNSYLIPNDMASSNSMNESSTVQIMAPSVTLQSSFEPQSLSYPLPNKHSSAQGFKKDVELTSDQQNKLDQMIEYYSNKNKLSDEEKLIVRTIIAQQIQNKSLPTPSSDTSQVSAPENIEGNQEQSKSGADKPAILHGQKRKYLLTGPCETPQKRIKKSRRKEKLISREYDSVDKASSKTTEDSLHDKSTDFESSPLLNVYLNATRAEHVTDDKLVKKWRDVVWNLSRHSVHMDVPWLSKRGHRDKENRLPPPPQSSKRSHLLYQIKSEDGYCAEGTDLQELVNNLLDSVQECRANAFIPSPSLCLASILSPYAFLGVSHDTVRFLVEQLPGARHCLRYRAKYHKHREPPTEVITHINPHGCARAEKYQGRSKPDMFSFLASKHRLPPSYDPSLTQNVDMQQNSTRRPTSMDLPMAMRFRHLRTSAHEAVGVYRSAIHGRGLYCKRDIEAGEMVMEYTGEVIRCFLTDHREKMYEKKGIGCYMFRMDDMYVVDATMMGSGARFINHSCEPSCYSRIVTIDGKKHIIIFALRKILRGEELTYDYKFPIEADDQKIMCNCGARTCRKYMN